MMLGLLFCLVLGEKLQPNTLSAAFRTSLTQLERTYGDRATNLYGLISLNVFRVGTLAMTLYAFTYSRAPFSILVFLYIALGVIGFVVLKSFVSWLISYTFDLRRATVLFAPQYDNIWTILCVLLYPVTLLHMNIGGHVLQWVLLALTLLFVILTAFKFWQYYFSAGLSWLYLTVYIVTLEILPLGAIWYAAGVFT